MRLIFHWGMRCMDGSSEFWSMFCALLFFFYSGAPDFGMRAPPSVLWSQKLIWVYADSGVPRLIMRKLGSTSGWEVQSRGSVTHVHKIRPRPQAGEAKKGGKEIACLVQRLLKV